MWCNMLRLRHHVHIHARGQTSHNLQALVHADWDRTIAVLQKELAIAKARLEASASHERARELEFEALHEQLNNARAAVDHLQAQNFRILEELEQASVSSHLLAHISCILGALAKEDLGSSAGFCCPSFVCCRCVSSLLVS